MTVEQLLARLTGVKQAMDGWKACCPAHEDRNPSLSISVGDDGRVLLHCHAGCAPEAICRVIGLGVADLFTASTSTKPQQTPKNSQLRRRRQTGSPKSFGSRDAAVHSIERYAGSCVATWSYQGADCEELFQVLRFDGAEGKTFRPLRRDGQGWIVGDPAGPLPLYQLSELALAERVYVVEGEKCCDAARSIGLTATTSAHGAKSPQLTDWSPLAGKKVVLLPDNDDAGEQYIARVRELLSTLSPAPHVVTVQLPELPEHGDIVDFLEQHDAAEPEALREQIEALVAQVIETALPNNQSPTLKAKSFPVELLPEPIRTFVRIASEAMGCDSSYVALPLLAVCASAIGNTRRIQLKHAWSEPAILWTAVVGESGTLKTPAFKLVMRPLREYQAKAFAAHEEELVAYRRATLEYERAMRQWNRSKTTELPPDAPLMPKAARFVVSDCTVEAIAPLLKANPRGLLMARDELSGWIGSFDRYAQARGADAAHWLSMHNGETMTVDRKTGQPPTIDVPRAAVSVAGGIQPGILARALTREHRESGLAARLLLSWPERQVKRWTETDIDPELENAFGFVLERLLQLQPMSGEETACDPVLLSATDEGRQAWIEFYNQHARECADLCGDMAAVWSKLEGYAARLALVIHLMRWAAGDPNLMDEYVVDAHSIRTGIALSRWFGEEARRIYERFDETDEQQDERQLADWIRRRDGRVTIREVQQGHRRFRTSSDAQAALAQLAKAGWGVWEALPSGSKGGRPTEMFVLRESVQSGNDGNIV